MIPDFLLIGLTIIIPPFNQAPSMEAGLALA
jgi:hypothetical protein